MKPFKDKDFYECTLEEMQYSKEEKEQIAKAETPIQKEMEDYLDQYRRVIKEN